MVSGYGGSLLSLLPRYKRRDIQKETAEGKYIKIVKSYSNRNGKRRIGRLG